MVLDDGGTAYEKASMDSCLEAAVQFIVEFPRIFLPRGEEGIEVGWALVFDDVPCACKYAVFCNRVFPWYVLEG